MIWKKTPLGVAELKNRAMRIDPAARSLLLMLDGVKTQELLLAHMLGAKLEHFLALENQGLIERIRSSALGDAPKAPAPPSSRAATRITR